MPLGIAFFLLTTAVGLGTVRALRLATGWQAIGLAPAGGLALLIAVANWAAVLGLPNWLRAASLGLVGLLGVVVAARDGTFQRAISEAKEDRLGTGLLLAAVAMPVLLVGIGFVGVAVPLSSHDGAAHVEAIHALRQGARPEGWYPPGFLATAAAFLQFVPWVDTAEGTFGSALGLAVLAPLSVFGLGCAVWRKPVVAAAGALFVALSYQYPYSLHVWSGWPLAATVVLVLGLWTATQKYFEQPGTRWTCFGGLLLAAIVLTHGTEVYTASLGLLILTAAAWRRLPYRRLAREIGIGVVLALAVASSYVPTLLGWIGVGGAARVGYDALQSPVVMARVGLAGELLALESLISTGTFVDAPVRILLLVGGLWWALRTRTARVLLPLYLVFFALGVIFTYGDIPIAQQVFALTFPWGLKDRLEQIQVIALGMLEGAGLVVLIRALPTLRTRWPDTWGAKHPTVWRRTVVACLILAFFSTEASMVAIGKTLSSSAAAVAAYSPDDAQAMAWLRQHGQPGDVVANDWAADAGIWAPYKANLPVLAPRTLLGDPSARELVLSNVADLDAVPEARGAACSLGARWVFRGARGTAYQPRRFPSLAELRRSPGLEEVFASGEAAVFRVRLACQE